MVKQNRTRNGTITVATSSTKVADACFQERVQINLTNTSALGETISIGIGQEAVAGSGIVLYPGGSYSETKNDSSDIITQEEINAVGSAATATLAFVERVRMDVRE